MADVDDLVAELVARLRPVAAAELGESRGARPDLKPPSIAGDLALELLEEDRPDGPRPDQAHVALDDVEELRQLIELPLLEELADRRIDRIPFREETRADLLLGIHLERAELVDVEDALVLAHPLPAIEDGAAAAELDAEGDEQHDRRQQEETHQAQQDLERPRHHVLPARRQERHAGGMHGGATEAHAHVMRSAAGGRQERMWGPRRPEAALTVATGASEPYSSCQSAKIKRPQRFRL